MDIHSKKASSTLRTLRQSDVYVYICIYICIPLYHPWTIHKPPSEKRKRGKAGDVEHGRKSFLPKSIAPSLESVRANSARIG